jgi:hypothetical protein
MPKYTVTMTIRYTDTKVFDAATARAAQEMAEVDYRRPLTASTGVTVPGWTMTNFEAECAVENEGRRE